MAMMTKCVTDLYGSVIGRDLLQVETDVRQTDRQTYRHLVSRTERERERERERNREERVYSQLYTETNKHKDRHIYSYRIYTHTHTHRERNRERGCIQLYRDKQTQRQTYIFI